MDDRWEQLVRLEPKLAELLKRIRKVKPDPAKNYFCANLVWYGVGGFKCEMLHLVGDFRPDEHPILSTRDAYDIAYDTLYAALPDCFNCACIRGIHGVTIR